MSKPLARRKNSSPLGILPVFKQTLALGQNRNYIQGITSGKALPSMGQFLNICEYFEITPMQFFDGRGLYPELVRKAMDSMCELNGSDMLLVLNLVKRLTHQEHCAH